MNCKKEYRKFYHLGKNQLWQVLCNLEFLKEQITVCENTNELEKNNLLKYITEIEITCENMNDTLSEMHQHAVEMMTETECNGHTTGSTAD